MTEKKIKWIENKLNNRPRKRLEYITPNENFKQFLNMKRRVFIEKLCIGGSLLFVGKYASFCSSEQKSLRFGLITDLHYADREKAGNRFYAESVDKLEVAMEQFKNSSVDFVIELGDFKDQGKQPNKKETLLFLDKIEKVYQSFGGKAYHVLGNHDMDSLSKGEFLSHTFNSGKANGKNFYSFVVRGVKCIVLDANYNRDGSDYDTGNFDWKYAIIPQKQKEWLANELQEGYEPVLIFVHQLLNKNAPSSVRVSNAEEVRQILEQSKRVLAVIQGHHHKGHYEINNNIHYFTMKGAVEGEFPSNNSYAIVEVTSNGDIYINGFVNCQDMTLNK